MLYAKHELDDVQLEIQQGKMDMQTRHKEREWKVRYVDLCFAEETFYKQKSRVKRIANGDIKSMGTGLLIKL